MLGALCSKHLVLFMLREKYLCRDSKNPAGLPRGLSFLV
jgi:hypothetical protein